MRFFQRFWRNKKGQGMVEFVLMLPIIIAVMFGAISMIYTAHGAIAVTNAARNAGRLAAIECGRGNPAWFNEAKNLAQQVLNHANLGTNRFIQVSGQGNQPKDWYVSATCTGTGGYVTLTVEYAQTNLFPPLAWFLRNQSGGIQYFALKETVVYPVE